MMWEIFAHLTEKTVGVMGIKMGAASGPQGKSVWM